MYLCVSWFFKWYFWTPIHSCYKTMTSIRNGGTFPHLWSTNMHIFVYFSSNVFPVKTQFWILVMNVFPITNIYYAVTQNKNFMLYIYITNNQMYTCHQIQQSRYVLLIQPFQSIWQYVHVQLFIILSVISYWQQIKRPESRNV